MHGLYLIKSIFQSAFWTNVSHAKKMIYYQSSFANMKGGRVALNPLIPRHSPSYGIRT